mmetsp:Transcript_28764/g.56368  ORF Transcript_28764/g.56368 Transcript_28764/m.56368 type:complete len:115 (+) Transcript_28764:449-793(+)
MIALLLLVIYFPKQATDMVRPVPQSWHFVLCMSQKAPPPLSFFSGSMSICALRFVWASVGVGVSLCRCGLHISVSASIGTYVPGLVRPFLDFLLTHLLHPKEKGRAAVKKRNVV